MSFNGDRRQATQLAVFEDEEVAQIRMGTNPRQLPGNRAPARRKSNTAGSNRALWHAIEFGPIFHPGRR